MRITVKVKAKARQEKIEKISEREFILWVREPAIEGRANEAVIEALSNYFAVAKSQISIVKGQKNKIKVIELV